jgi:hypothetical protein
MPISLVLSAILFRSLHTLVNISVCYFHGLGELCVLCKVDVRIAVPVSDASLLHVNPYFVGIKMQYNKVTTMHYPRMQWIIEILKYVRVNSQTLSLVTLCALCFVLIHI